MTDEITTALNLAADALDIAADWHIPNVQVHPPKEWGLQAFGESVDDGWCATRLLAGKLRELARERGGEGAEGDV